MDFVDLIIVIGSIATFAAMISPLIFAIYAIIKAIKKKFSSDNNNIIESPKVEKVTSVFMEDENGIFKPNNAAITKEELPTAVQMSYERMTRNSNHYCNRFEDILPPDRGNNRLNDAEIYLLKEFYKQLLSNKVKPYIYVGRMGDGTLDVSYKGTPIGRANLRGEQQYWFRYHVGKMGNSKDIDGDIDKIKPYINKWVRYIINYL